MRPSTVHWLLGLLAGYVVASPLSEWVSAALVLVLAVTSVWWDRTIARSAERKQAA